MNGERLKVCAVYCDGAWFGWAESAPERIFRGRSRWECVGKVLGDRLIPESIDEETLGPSGLRLVVKPSPDPFAAEAIGDMRFTVTKQPKAAVP